MTISRLKFWLFSVAVSLASCYLFVILSTDMVTDGEYMRGIHASPDHDTPALGIMGAVLAAVVFGVAHFVFMILFALLARFRRKAIVIDTSYFLIDFSRNNLLKTSIQSMGYLVSAYWIWDFILITDIKFFGSQFLFSVAAILVTWIYAVWVLNLFIRPVPEQVRNT